VGSPPSKDNLMAYEGLTKEILEIQWATLKEQKKHLLEPQMQVSWDSFKGNYNAASLKKWTESEATGWRSDVFVRLTKMKVVSATASIEDIMLQGGNLPWEVSPTENPVNAMSGIQLDEKLIEERCQNMKRKIKDTITETLAVWPFIGSIQEQSIYGWSFLSFPMLKDYERVSFEARVPEVGFIVPEELKNEQMRFFPKIEKYRLPSLVHPSVWDVYWDLEDPDPQKGQATIQRMDVSPGMLRAIAEESPHLYDMEVVNQVIGKFKDATGTTDSRNPYLATLPERKRGIVILSYYGRVEKTLLKKEGVDTVDRIGKETEILCALAGAEDDMMMIRPPKENRLPMKRRPLWISRWEHGMHEPGGIGIPENIKDAQQMVNSAYRRFIDNKSLAGNLMMAGKSGDLAPGQDRHPRPGKWFELAEHVQDVRAAIQYFSPPDIGDGLLDLINLAERFADEESNLPKILQGEMARHQPKTAFEMSKLVQSANKTLSKVIRNIDFEHVEPYIRALYTYFMIADPDENIKGDYTCKATGFNSFMDKQVKGANLLNMLTFALSNNLIMMMTEIPDLWREVAKSQDVDRFVKKNDKIDETANLVAMALQEQAQAQAMGPAPGGSGGKRALPTPAGGVAG